MIEQKCVYLPCWHFALWEPNLLGQYFDWDSVIHGIAGLCKIYLFMTQEIAFLQKR